jgi:hypothetical protein
MTNFENHFDNGEALIEENLEFEMGGRDIHPADDYSAKWTLLELFNDSLEYQFALIQ